MRKKEFIAELKSRLKGYPQDVINGAVGYYSECIDDAVEDGRSEEEAVRSLGDMDEIVRNTLKDVPLSKLVKERCAPKRQLSGIEIVLIVLGFPLWFPLLVTAWSLFFAFYVVIWSLIFAFAATAVALLASSVVACISGGAAFIAATPAIGVLAIGGAFVCLGAALLMFALLPALGKGGLALGRGFLLGVKKLFIRNGGND